MDQIQFLQNRHRKELIDFWAIPESSRVLEIGCGQGDTTAMLAKAVGKDGFVYGIDAAPGSYGAPITLQDAAIKLLNSAIGKNIKLSFETDIFSIVPGNDSFFDDVVLSHCSWYFSSEDLLYKTLLKARQYAKRLCFAEWDIRITATQQFQHYQAAMLLATCNSIQMQETANIKSLFSVYDISKVLKKAGWKVVRQTIVNSSYLDDGQWEVNEVLNEYEPIIRGFDSIPQKTKELLLSNLQVLKNSLTGNRVDALNTFVLLAE